jgi:hypothetical protein
LISQNQKPFLGTKDEGRDPSLPFGISPAADARKTAQLFLP